MWWSKKPLPQQLVVKDTELYEIMADMQRQLSDLRTTVARIERKVYRGQAKLSDPDVPVNDNSWIP
jgi:hypothetical protein